MINLNATNVSMDETFTPMLRDLQANIIKHHGRDFAFHLFIQFDDTKAVCKWIQSFAKKKITSAFRQLNSSKLHRENNLDGGTVFTLSLSKYGYEKLNIEKFMPGDSAFREGLKSRQQLLADNVEDWESEFTSNIDCLIIVADAKESNARKEVNKIANQLADIATVLKIQRGKVLKNGEIGIEHFGYADGISQPLYLKDEISAQGIRKQWDDSSTLDRLLVADSGGRDSNSYGSFLVFRKLEQNVKLFKAEEKKLPAVLDFNGFTDSELPGSMLVGRFEDGTETVNHSNSKGIKNASALENDFDFRDDKAGSKCPFHSHIRITNPRNDVGDFAKKVRITRRGIPYNDIGRNENDLENDQPENGVGLLFMCYQSDINGQFEHIQSVWANQGRVGGKLHGQDGVIGQGPNTTPKEEPDQWGNPNPAHVIDFSNATSKFVTMKGGEYFFTPSISCLKKLKCKSAKGLKHLGISGGGTKIAGLYGAAETIIFSKGYRPDIISGISAGAILAVPLAMAMKKPELRAKIRKMVLNPTMKQIFDIPPTNQKGKLRIFNAILRLVCGKSSFGSQANLKKTLGALITEELFHEYVSDEDFPICIVGTVDFYTGKNFYFNLKEQTYSNFLELVNASASLPIFTTGYAFDGVLKDFEGKSSTNSKALLFDGGVRDHSPTQRILKSTMFKSKIAETGTIFSRPKLLKDILNPNNFKAGKIMSILSRYVEITNAEVSKNDEQNEQRLIQASGGKIFDHGIVYLDRVMDEVYEVDAQKAHSLYYASIRTAQNQWI